MSEIRLKLKELLGKLSSKLTNRDFEQISELLTVGELKVGFENFCTQLHERDAVCTANEIQEIASIGIALGVRENYWGIIASEYSG